LSYALYGKLKFKKGGESNLSEGAQRPLPLQIVIEVWFVEPDLQRVMDIG
jgi:hypothetical protein